MSSKVPGTITGGALAQMSDDELVAIRKAVEAEERRRLTKKKRDARKMIVDIAEQNGIDLASLAGGKAGENYRDPDNQFNTWNGRGRKPQWVRAALARGLTLEDLIV